MQKPLGFDLKSLTRRIGNISRTGVFSNRGPELQELEDRIAGALCVQRERVIAITNGTVAVQAFLASSGVRAWMVPNFTFAATGLAAMASGKRVILYDTDPSSMTPKVSPAVRSRYGLVAVESFGEELTEPQLRQIRSSREGLIDAAAGLGNALERKEYLYTSAATMFSLHATKVVGAGEGALLVLDENSDAEYIRSWINFGFMGQRVSATTGTNGKMSELAAAAVNSVLDVWPERSQLWRETRDMVYGLESIFDSDHFHSQTSISPYWILKTKDRDHSSRFRESLTNVSIDNRLWWSGGLHSMAAFSRLARYRRFAGSRELSEVCVGVPYFAGMPRNLAEEILRIYNATHSK